MGVSSRMQKIPNPSGSRIFRFGGPYRDRTDDIHGVNVTLYQLS